MRALLVPIVLFASVAFASPADSLLTTAEASGFRSTTLYPEVVDFLQAIEGSGGIHLTVFGKSFEGRDLPLAVVGAKSASAEDVLAAGRLRVLVFANIHAGEVAGKEAALMLLRDLSRGMHSHWREEMVLLVAPIFNADGNERIDPTNRPLQHGPVDGIGTRANAQGLDLNRDFEKLDSPEGRALVDLFNRYDPHVVVDLHTTNGTVHAYHLTYAPPLHPVTAVPIDRFLRDEWLPALRVGMRSRGFETYLYGNDKPEWGLPPDGWSTFDPRPRFVTNHVGLRNRFAILSEAYSYASFEERILATKAFVEEILDFAATWSEDIKSIVDRLDDASIIGRDLPTRAAGNWLADGAPGEILLGEVVVEANPHTGEPMWLRTDSRRPVELTLYQRFAGTDSTRVPAAFLIPTSEEDAIERLLAHGIRTEAMPSTKAVPVERFMVETMTASPQPFQGRTTYELTGAYHALTQDVLEGDYLLVRMDQPLARLAFLLLEPRSDAGFAAWGILLPHGEAAPHPVLRLASLDGEPVLEGP